MKNRKEKGMQDFVDYMMEAENAELWKKTGSVLHNSPEGGLKTLGFGHKLNQIEQSTGQVMGKPIRDFTREDAEALLRQDINARANALAQRLGPSWKSLSRREQEMLLDIEYNVGSVERTFPSFTKAVLSGDLETQRKEYERFFTDPKTGKEKPIKERNRLFYERYLSDDALKAWEELDETRR